MSAIIIVVGLLAILALALVAISEDQGSLRRYRRRIARQLTARAEQQNAAALRDEPLGIYGEYMPPKDLL